MQTVDFIKRRSWARLARRIEKLASALQRESDAQLQSRASQLRWEAQANVPLRRLLPEVYALVSEQLRRRSGLTPYPVQLMAAIGLVGGRVIEMQTGEGKTLTALMPIALRALRGRACHVFTANDYLAGRDAEFGRPVFESLGLSVASLSHGLSAEERRAAYACDITYGAEKEFGFDYLRDELAIAENDSHPRMQRPPYFALIDEADSILIDQARTPLVIAAPAAHDPAQVRLIQWCHSLAARLQEQAEYRRESTLSVRLTDQGCRRVLLSDKPPQLARFSTERLYRQVERSLSARHQLIADRDFIVTNDKLELVDESTGRVLSGRKWQAGLHEAAEIAAGLPLTERTGESARITLQRFLNRYPNLAGMTGTAQPVRSELRTVYGISTVSVPPHRRCRRITHPPRIFSSRRAKLTVVCEEIVRLRAAGRPVLVGTPSIVASQAMSAALDASGIEHTLLDARHDAEEADIVSRAGRSAQVTVATNMAGRGTDIALCTAARKAGGLHVIATEMHSSQRIDRQLIGRAARQGDPGSCQFFLSLEDELLHVLTSKQERRIEETRRRHPDAELKPDWLSLFRRAQRLCERHHYRQRVDLQRRDEQLQTVYRELGLNPCLESFDSGEDV